MKKLRVGVIGAGVRGRHSWERLLAAHPDCEVVALAFDPATSPAMLEGYRSIDAREEADRLGATFHRDPERLLAEAEVDIVSLMVEPPRVPELGARLCERGIGFVTDKPVAADLQGARALLEVWRDHPVPVLVTYHPRYYAGVQEARSLLASARLGALRGLDVTMLFHGGPPAGFVATRGYAASMGGGELINFGSYAIDAWQWLSGQRIERVLAVRGSFFYHDYRAADMEDFATLLVEGERGCRGQITTGRLPFHGGGPILEIDLLGDAGDVRVQAPDATLACTSAAGGGWVHADGGQSRRMMDAYVAAVQRHSPSPIGLDAGVSVQEVLTMAYRSAETGAWVERSEV